MSDDTIINAEGESAPACDSGAGRGIVRGEAGRFAKGTKAGSGNPHARHVMKHRRAMFRSADPQDAVRAFDVLKQIMLDPEAHNRDRLKAAAEVLDRLIGKPAAVEAEGGVQRKLIQMFLQEADFSRHLHVHQQQKGPQGE